jgi:hypothetical protein
MTAMAGEVTRLYEALGPSMARKTLVSVGS